jgi:hypothetical protein
VGWAGRSSRSRRRRWRACELLIEVGSRRGHTRCRGSPQTSLGQFFYPGIHGCGICGVEAQLFA